MDELAQTAMDAVTERPREDHARTLRQRLSRLARREARLADRPAAVVGASDSGVDDDFATVTNVAEDEWRQRIDRRQMRLSDDCGATTIVQVRLTMQFGEH